MISAFRQDHYDYYYLLFCKTVTFFQHKSASVGLVAAGKLVAVVKLANVTVIVHVLDVQSSANVQVRRLSLRNSFVSKK